MTPSDRPSILAAWIKYRFKKHRFHFQNLGKTMRFCSETLYKHYIEYTRIVCVWIHIYCSETRILKEYVVQKPDCFRLIASKLDLIEAAVHRCFSKQVIL